MEKAVRVFHLLRLQFPDFKKREAFIKLFPLFITPFFLFLFLLFVIFFFIYPFYLSSFSLLAIFAQVSLSVTVLLNTKEPSFESTKSTQK